MPSALIRAAMLTCVASLVSTQAFAEYRPGGAAQVEPYRPGAASKPDNRPVIRVCTGKQDAVYFYAASVMAAPGNPFLIQPVLTEGAFENAQKVTEGVCEAGFTQEDALRVYRDIDARADAGIERGLTMYPEYVHLLCNREAKIGKLTDLKKGHVVAIGPEGSGAHAVWDAIVSTDKKRWDPNGAGPSTNTKSGLRALTAVQDGAEVTCALSVGALGNSTLKKDAQKFADKVVLVPVNEGVDSLKDAKGKSIYSYAAIPAGTYGALMPSGMLFGHNEAQTFTVNAVFIANAGWADKYPKLYEAVLRAVTNALPKIKERAKG